MITLNTQEDIQKLKNQCLAEIQRSFSYSSSSSFFNYTEIAAKLLYIIDLPISSELASQEVINVLDRFSEQQISEFYSQLIIYEIDEIKEIIDQCYLSERINSKYFSELLK